MEAPQLITGPPTSKVSREDAEATLVRHPLFPKNASYTLEEVEGRWIAAVAPKQSAPPEAFQDGGGAGDTPDGPPEPEEAPKGPDLEGDDHADGEDKPSKDDGKGEKKGLEAQVEHLTELLTKVVDALGLGGPDDSLVPGPDDAIPETPGPPPPGAEPPSGPDDGPQKIRHERSLKPGEAAPGTTPVGAPAFASVRDDHPWKPILGIKRTFKLEEPIGDQKIADVKAELDALAAEAAPYRVEQIREGADENGQRVARVLISR